MIQREFYTTRQDGVKLYRTYSDENKYIKKVGTEEIYSEAIDVEGATFMYEETNEFIPKEEGEALQKKVSAELMAKADAEARANEVAG